MVHALNVITTWLFFIFITVCTHWYTFKKKNSGAFPEAYDTVSDILASCQLAAFLEVIHPVIGIVRTGALAPFMQVDLFSAYYSVSENSYEQCFVDPHSHEIDILVSL